MNRSVASHNQNPFTAEDAKVDEIGK